MRVVETEHGQAYEVALPDRVVLVDKALADLAGDPEQFARDEALRAAR